MGKRLQRLTTLEVQADELRKRVAACEKALIERRQTESSLLSRLRTASVRVRDHKETRALVHGEQIRVREPGWLANKRIFHTAFQKETERTEAFVASLEALLDIEPTKKTTTRKKSVKKVVTKKNGVAWRQRGLRREDVKADRVDPVVEEAKKAILKHLQQKKTGLRKSEILGALSMKGYLFQHAVRSLGSEGLIKKEGSRRMMTYEAC